MGRFLSGIFGSNQKNAPAISLRVTTSLQGVPIPILLGGQNRLACSLIWYGNFYYQNASTSGGGKGGAGAGGSKGDTGNYDYFASFILAICEGPVSAFIRWYLNSGASGFNTGGFSQFSGAYNQSPWGWLEAFSAPQALAYRGIAYIAQENYPLGSTPALPNFTVETLSPNAGAIQGSPDADPSLCWNALLSNVHWGVGFPAARMGVLNANASSWSSYCIALGLTMSPVLTSQTAASSIMSDMLAATNSNACWQNGQLTVIPYGDTAVQRGSVSTITETHVVPAPDSDGYSRVTVGAGANYVSDGGVTTSGGSPFTPVTTPPGTNQYEISPAGTYIFQGQEDGTTVLITYSKAATTSYVPTTRNIYDFTFDDTLENQGTIGTGLATANSPLICVRTSRDQIFNNIKVEYLDRSNNYNPVDIEVKDEASIVAFGRERPSDLKQFHFFCIGSAAQQSAALLLIRQQIARTFQWTCGKHFLMILELMAICTVTDAGQGLSRQPVRIIEIQENADFSLTVTAEEFLGTASAPLYGLQANSGYSPNFNEAPGPVNAPVIFEPSDELGGGLQIWGAVCGSVPATWGGCQVWASFDDVTYKQVGTILGPARMGVLSASLPSIAVNPTGQTIDQTNTLGVDLTESLGALSSGTALDATSLNTACLVGDEIVAYQTATLTAANKYNLTYLVRGAYGTEAEIAAWPAGTPFVRLDQGVFDVPFEQNQIGATVYLKFPSFNQWQGGQEALDEVPAYSYRITGAALASPLPDVANFRTVYVDGVTNLDWDEISDFRTVQYEIRLGSAWASALVLGTVAHPPFATRGNGTFWVSARAQPVANLIVYSELPTAIDVSGNLLTTNILESWDEAATGWTGSVSGNASVVGDLLEVNPGSGTYLIPPGHIINAGRSAPCAVTVTWAAEGTPLGDNILAYANLLAQADILGSASTQYVSAYPDIQVGQGTTNVYALADVYAVTDIYAVSPVWSAWQKFSPGTYVGWFFNFRINLSTIDPGTIAAASAFSFTVDAPARQDHVTNFALGSGGQTFVFTPDGSATAAAFNGGPNGSAVPYVSVTILNPSAGDYVVISGTTLAQTTIQVLNAGSGVARNINADFEGY